MAAEEAHEPSASSIRRGPKWTRVVLSPTIWAIVVAVVGFRGLLLNWDSISIRLGDPASEIRIQYGHFTEVPLLIGLYGAISWGAFIGFIARATKWDWRQSQHGELS